MSDEPTRSDRGFKQYPPLESLYGGEVRVVESSLATQPAVWLFTKCPANLNEPDGPWDEVSVHLSAEDAWRLAGQLRHVVEHHYQGDARPEVEAPS